MRFVILLAAILISVAIDHTRGPIPELTQILGWLLIGTAIMDIAEWLKNLLMRTIKNDKAN